MGDSFQQSLTIWHIPEPDTTATNLAEAIDVVDPYQAIADVINEQFGWARDWACAHHEFTAAEIRATTFEDDFMVDEGRYDELENIGAVLTKMSATWSGVVHPKYEYPGTYYAHVPELGTFSGDCDDDGNVTLTEHTLRTKVYELETIEEVRTWIDDATGKAWHDRFNQIAEAAKEGA